MQEETAAAKEINHMHKEKTESATPLLSGLGDRTYT